MTKDGGYNNYEHKQAAFAPKRRLRFRLKLELLLYLCGVDQFKQESKNGTNSPCSCSLQMPSM